MFVKALRTLPRLAVAFGLAAALPLLSVQETLVIKAKRIHTAANGIVTDGAILVENGKVVKVGRDIRVPAGAKVLEAETVIPGLVDIHGHLGVYPVPVVEENLDGNEATDPITPQLRALDSFDFDDPAIPAALAGGVTTVVSRPGSLNVICGTSVAVKMKKAKPADMVLKEECDLKMAVEGNPSGWYANLHRMPSTVMAVYHVARKAFIEAQEYRRSWEAYEADRKAGKDVLPPKKDLGKETLVRCLKREMPVHIHCYTASQIMTSIRLADEFGFRLSLGHSDKAYLLVDELARRKDIYVNVGPAVFDTYPQNAMVFANVPAILARAGIKVSLQTDAGAEQQNLREFASLCVRYGMSEEDALRSITSWAAEAVDLADRVGSIAPGRDADLVLLDGPPFEFRTAVRAVVVDGKVEYRNPLPERPAAAAARVEGALRVPAAAREGGRFALKGATVYTMAGPPIAGGVVLVKDGKIEKAGGNVAVPDGCPVIDATGFVIMPGLVLARTQIGLGDNWRKQSEKDETSGPVTPEIEVKHGVEVQDPHFYFSRQQGITSALVTPGDLNVIGGRGLALKMRGDIVDRMIIKDQAVMVFGFGKSARRKGEMPTTRMGIAALLRGTLTKALEYRDMRASWDKRKEGPEPARDLSLEALVPVVEGKMPVIAHAERMDDILTALRLADEFKLKLILDGATDAYRVVDEIKKRGVPVILEEILRGVGQVEDAGFSNSNPAILAKAGIPVAFRSKEGLWQWPAAGQPGGDPLEVAAFAVRYGMPEDAALRAVTIDAARIAGIADRVGSLEPGKDADILVLRGHPLGTTSIPEAVFMDGKLVYQSRPDEHIALELIK
jgi:imidazolonepropionase-like amidohydrolase